MNENGDILLVADRNPPGLLGTQLRNGRVVRIPDPYDALMEMGRRRWGAVLLTAPRPDFAGLCRASRRLQPDCPIFGLCPPPAEPEVRPLVGKILTDYFICPPTKRDLDRILRAPTKAPRSVTVDEPVTELSPEIFAQLLGAAHSVSSLEHRLSQLISRHLGVPVIWKDVKTVRGGPRPLLLAAGEVPRVLVPEDPGERIAAAAQVFLDAVQQCVPALMAAAQRTETLHRLAITDPLTGAYNRRYFYHLTDQILLRAGEKNLRVTLLLYDIDDFKRYNDTYGYAGGDDVLREAAELMKRTTREHDIVARIGGDEFAVLFWDTEQPRKPGSHPPDSAIILADRFLQTISRHEFPSLGPEATGVLTISGGLASFPKDGRTCRELLRSADKALKQVKRSGKSAIRIVGRD